MTDSKTKLKEVLAVMNVMLLISDKDTTLSHQDYIKAIKNLYDLDIDRRRVSQILNDLYDIGHEDNDYFPFFEIKESEKGKGKFYIDKTDLRGIAKIIKGIDTTRPLTSKERKDIIGYIYSFFTENERKEIESWL